jgi:hypothetical protein
MPGLIVGLHASGGLSGTLATGGVSGVWLSALVVVCVETGSMLGATSVSGFLIVRNTSIHE